MDAEKLRAVHERLKASLQQFFSDAVAADPALKTSLEGQLARFSEQPWAPQAAQSFLQHSTDKYVLWYSASLLQKLVTTPKWASVDDAAAAAIRTAVLTGLATKACSTSAGSGGLGGGGGGGGSTTTTTVVGGSSNVWPRMVVEKAMGLLCTIALYDFPHRYPTYFKDVLALVTKPATLEVGIRLMRFSLEEFPLLPSSAAQAARSTGRRSAAFSLPTKRVDELASFMQKHLGNFVPVLQGVLADPAREARAGEDALRSLEVGTSVPCVRSSFVWANNTNPRAIRQPHMMKVVVFTQTCVRTEGPRRRVRVLTRSLSHPSTHPPVH